MSHKHCTIGGLWSFPTEILGNGPSCLDRQGEDVDYKLSSGLLTRVAGEAASGYAGDGGPALVLCSTTQADWR